MSTKRDREQLKTYFETGDRPTEEEFAELIDSGLNQEDDDIHSDGNKNIGIGTNTPDSKLQVDGDTHLNQDLQVDGNAQIKGDIFGKDQNWSALNIMSSKQGATGGAYVHMHGSEQAENPQGDPHHNQGGFTFVASGNGNNNGFSFLHFNVDNHNNVPNDGNSETWHRSLRINGHGNIGVNLGGDEPTSKLHVNGNVRVNDNDIYLRGDTDKNHGIGFYGPDKGVFKNGDDDVNVDGPVVYGFGGGALGINQNGTQYVNLHWDHNRRVGIGGLGGMQHHPARLQVWGDGNHAPVQIETAHNDAIKFHDADGSNTNPFTLVDKNGDRGFRFYAQGQDWKTIAEFTKNGSKVRKGLEIHSVGNASKTGLKLPSGADSGRILVSDDDGNASWQDKTVVTNGLWGKVGNTDHIRNENIDNVGIGTSTTHIPRAKLEVNGGIVADSLTGDHSLFLHASANPSVHAANIGLYNQNASVNSGGIDFNIRGDINSRSFRFINRDVSGNGNVVMKINGHGNVGIGTVTPNHNLDVNGTANFSGDILTAGMSPIIIKRFSTSVSELSGNGHDTGISFSDYEGASVAGFAALGGTVKMESFKQGEFQDILNITHDIDTDAMRLNHYVSVFRAGSTWRISADFPSHSVGFEVKHEKWNVDIMFIHKGLVEIQGSNWYKSLGNQ